MAYKQSTYMIDRWEPGGRSNIRRNSLINLQIYYDDCTQNLKLCCNLAFSPTNTIDDVVKELLKKAKPNYKLPDDISLVGLGIDNECFAPDLHNKFKTLEELRIKQGYDLYFQPTRSISSSKASRLVVWGPDNINKVGYRWTKNITTLKMLLEFIIETFSLQSIERERIHLFKENEELDLASNSDKLLDQLGIEDSSWIHIEIIPNLSLSASRMNTSIYGRASSSLNKHGSATFLSQTGTNKYIELVLHYVDQKQDVNKVVQDKFSRKETLRDIIQKLIKKCDLHHILPDDIRLVRCSDGDQHFHVLSSSPENTLDGLKIKEGCILYFELFPNDASHRKSILTVWGPNRIDKIEYQWNKMTTTLRMLLEYIIKEFSLESIAVERIHLLTLLDNELDIISDSDKLLSSIGITDQVAIYVEIVPSRSSTMVRVQYVYDNETRVLDVLHTITIEELQTQFEKIFKDYSMFNFKLLHNDNSEIFISSLNSTLVSLGIKPGESIIANYRLVSEVRSSHQDTQQITVPRSQSCDIKYQLDYIKIIFESSTFESIIATASLSDTVDILIKKIEALNRNRPLAKLHMTSESITIDDKQRDRCLADLGIKPGATIYVRILDNTSVNNSNSINCVTTSSSLTSHSRTQKYSLKPVGLYNLGNTCYMNSALQCLAHVTPLTEFFLDSLCQYISDDDKSTDTEWNQFYTVGTMTGVYVDLLRNLWLSDRTRNYYSSFQPTHLKEIIANRAPRFATLEQQDVQEFMTFLLDEINKELKEKNGYETNTIIEDLFFGKIQSTITCLECKHQETTTNPISFLPLPLIEQEVTFMITFIPRYDNQIFKQVNVSESGRVKNLIETFVESCGSRLFMRKIKAMANNEILNLETLLNQLPTKEVVLRETDEFISSLYFNRFDKPPKILTLEGCLQEFFSPEDLQDSCLCQQETCKKYTKAAKQLRLYSLPSILIIQLKRFSHEDGFRKKIDTFVDYPINGLNLTDCLSLEDEAIYDLFAVSQHIGSIYGGHYIACARHEVNGKNEWYKFDDSYVSSACSKNDIVSKNAYLLFYRRRENLKMSMPVITS